MRDHDHRPLWAAQRVHAFGNDSQRVDVEAGIGLVENRQLRLQNCHLQNFVALFLAAGEAFVDRPIHQLLIHFEQLQLLAKEGQKIHRVHFILPVILANGIQRRAQKVRVADAGNFDRILKRQKHAFAGGVFRFHFEQVFAVVEDLRLR